MTNQTLFTPLFNDPEIDGLFGSKFMLDNFLAFETALTRALLEVGAVREDEASAALSGFETFSPDLDELLTELAIDGLPVPQFVHQLKAHVGELGSRAVHIGTTSQDLIDTSIVQSMILTGDILCDRVNAVLSGLNLVEGQFGDAPLMGRTRMQAALPITVSSRITAWREPLIRHLERWKGTRRRVNRIQFSGPVGVRNVPEGKGDVVAKMIANELGMPHFGPSWQTGRDSFVEFGNWLVLLTGSLAKIGQDISLMVQQGINEAKISGGGSSSAMPHKTNPILAEMLITLARYTAAQQGGLAQALVHEQERSGAAWTLELLILPQMACASGAATRHCIELIKQIEHLGTK